MAACLRRVTMFGMETPDTAVVIAFPRTAVTRSDQIRLAAAWLITLLLLPYCWARTLVVGMITRGCPETLFTAATVILCVVVAGLVAGRAVLWSPRARWMLAAGVLLSWLAVNTLVAWSAIGEGLPPRVVAPIFLGMTLWVPWISWVWAFPMPDAARYGGFVAAILAWLVGMGLLRAEGMDGDAKTSFVWVWTPEAPYIGPPTAEDVADGPADLAAAAPDDWPRHLGPTGLAVAAGARLSPDWKSHPPRLVWRRPVGLGWSGFAVVGGYAVTQEQLSGSECVNCYRIADGKWVWMHEDIVRFESSMGGPGPRATPTIADGRVYTIGATGLLNCLNGADGAKIWSADVLADHGGRNLMHGVSGSPLVDAGRVIVGVPNAGVTLAAYDAATGAKLWTAGTDGASYGTPLAAELGGVRQILIHASEAVAGHAADNGRLLWRLPWTNTNGINCGVPVPDAGGPGQVLASTGYDKGAVLIRAARAADGAWSVAAAWESRALKTKFTQPVVLDGHAYGLDDGILACVSLADGRRVWKGGRYGHGQVLLAGDLLIVQAENGEVALVQAAPDGHRELGRIPALTGKTWNHPALAGRYLLVRNDREAACWELPVLGE